MTLAKRKRAHFNHGLPVDANSFRVTRSATVREADLFVLHVCGALRTLRAFALHVHAMQAITTLPPRSRWRVTAAPARWSVRPMVAGVVVPSSADVCVRIPDSFPDWA